MHGRGVLPVAALAAFALALFAASCGDDDGSETVTATVTEPAGIETETTEPDIATEGDETTEATSGPQPYPGSSDQGEREIMNTLREFNRTANLGEHQEACETYFSSAFLARLRSERECANSIAAARPGKGGKVQIDFRYVTTGSLEEGTSTAHVAFGERTDPDTWREIEMVYEGGDWRIDAVTVP